MESYKTTLVSRGGAQETQRFERFTDAILWLAGELEASDGFAVYGEIRFKDSLLWRRGRHPTPDKLRIAADSIV